MISAAPVRLTRRAALWMEFLALFVGVPLAMVAFFGSYSLFALVWIVTGLALVLLALTPGFRFRALLRGPVLGEWRAILVCSAATAATCLAFVLWLRPDQLFAMPRHRTEFWALLLLLYPIFSALPQEIIYRSLFFERYGALFPDRRLAIAANGAAFGLAHLFYMNPVTIGMTAVGGAVIGWAYLRNRSLPLAWLLHAIAGSMLFTFGLGVYFYSGAIGRAW